MGKKIDLNKPRNNDNIGKKNHRFFHYNNQIPQSDPKDGLEQEKGTSELEKKAANIAMQAAGVPKGLANAVTENEKLYNAAKNATFTLKMPLPIKILIPVALIAVPFIGLLLFVVLFSTDGSSSGHGSFKYGVTCPTVTVTDTGCNASAKNCTHRYDGQVAFEDYVAGVVAAEVGSANNLEFYKVAAIAARTYFLRQADSSCTIKGNATRQAYMDVNASSKAELIKQAVEETKSLVLVKNDKLSPTHYASACVVNDDGEYYHVRYGTISLGKANFQKIPKSWDSDSSHAYSGYLRSWYSDVDKSNTNYETKKCPGNHDYGMSQLGALYLATAENYNYEQIIKYYYGEDAEIMLNEVQLTEGSEGFVNPTRKIYCTSAFGWRIHPVKGTKKFHTGLDIGISGGEPIYAAANGTVREVRKSVKGINNCNYGYGNYIIIDHGDGMSTLYAHIRYGSIPSSITVGASVSQGEQIGAVGSTGCSTGNHLHYEVRKNNKQVDPTDYMDLTNAKGTCKR